FTGPWGVIEGGMEETRAPRPPPRQRIWGAQLAAPVRKPPLRSDRIPAGRRRTHDDQHLACDWAAIPSLDHSEHVSRFGRCRRYGRAGRDRGATLARLDQIVAGRDRILCR